MLRAVIYSFVEVQYSSLQLSHLFSLMQERFVSDSSWSSSESSDEGYSSSNESSGDVFSLEAVPILIGQEQPCGEQLKRSNPKSLLTKVKFGLTLSSSERKAFKNLVSEFSDLFVTRQADLPLLTWRNTTSISKIML